MDTTCLAVPVLIEHHPTIVDQGIDLLIPAPESDDNLFVTLSENQYHTISLLLRGRGATTAHAMHRVRVRLFLDVCHSYISIS